MADENIEVMLKANQEILERIRKIDFFIEYGIEGLRKKILKDREGDKKMDTKQRLCYQIQQDQSLKYPHKKIMSALIENYDYEKDEFKEMCFSEIVRKAKVGKNKAKEYLEFLKEKKLVGLRTDGYRKLYKVKRNTEL